MKKVAVILSGSGVYDGSEIHEAVLALYAIEKAGATWHCFAPNIDQLHVINHLTGDEMDETRNVLIESARIARGNIDDVAKLNVDEYDALLLPGGFGAAKNLTDFAVSGAECSINTHVAQACRAFANAKKPAGYLCISPVIIPMIYEQGVKGTVGNDEAVSIAFNQMGGEHTTCPVEDIVFDEKHLVLSTPAYMLAENISQEASGIEKLVSKLIKIA
ncbi:MULTISPECIES: isoprenoid biosynthesis glyoxalase ElbB [unclassified Vibrio]|uniref:isoprenoid biosynthesis glyoxalase ElbB n=1 Tax=unclassified Vibrio TaxID=2614977 RepID=UPI002965484F|nr:MULTISPECIES: isoprenoid biosynthesis glyoxalase ElbB [unclassified Vibrio]MDW1579220.1 isoprenoid biosynthesis glyoxalase ElbB [Vibrio sp. Vb2897]MDW1584821.1 isoprenoid biosynthesis glyoxalase ElbB [Vibrio sp. Vb2910]MDW1594136.1 isoprenoid biosynthesis glyoxalase ElbB [Vibrio sp. Vb2911]MDW1637481.1 isoprenoid biosynthesis glyoxalase ElbB [Vibrio sp. Vb2896]MDW1647784.1 isoprenoid biosynthesis glyoxalase ElbB [Vibrio sp. Vb2912]